MTVTIDLDAQLDSVRGLKGDLDDAFSLHGERLSPADREGLHVAIGQMAQRVTAFEEVCRRAAAEQVQVDRLTHDEVRALDRALVVLQGEFVLEDGLSSSTMWSRIRRLLAAMDELLLTAARGVSAGEQKPASTSGRGVVVALSRTAR
jgi:hypothetical protein